MLNASRRESLVGLMICLNWFDFSGMDSSKTWFVSFALGFGFDEPLCSSVFLLKNIKSTN